MEFDAEYRAHADTVFRYILSLTRDRALAEDIVQETFVEAMRCASKYDGSCAVSTWLCAIAKRRLMMWRRKHPSEAELPENGETRSAEDEAISGMGGVDLLRRLHALEEPSREIAYLRIFGALSFREIGEILEISENRARVTYYRARTRLQRGLEENE